MRYALTRVGVSDSTPSAWPSWIGTLILSALLVLTGCVSGPERTCRSSVDRPRRVPRRDQSSIEARERRSANLQHARCIRGCCHSTVHPVSCLLSASAGRRQSLPGGNRLSSTLSSLALCSPHARIAAPVRARWSAGQSRRRPRERAGRRQGTHARGDDQDGRRRAAHDGLHHPAADQTGRASPAVRCEREGPRPRHAANRRTSSIGSPRARWASTLEPEADSRGGLGPDGSGRAPRPPRRRGPR